MSPTQRTLAHMRSNHFRCAIVERWNAHAKIRQDLYGFVDVLCVGNGKTVAVQCTSGSNVSARMNKILGRWVPDDVKGERAWQELRHCVRECLAAGWEIQVHGWTKGKPDPRVEFISEADFGPSQEIDQEPF